MRTELPELPYARWRATRNTLQLYAQIVGKVRLRTAPKRNHWWHVSMRVTPRGLTTGWVPDRRGGFEIEMDLLDHAVDVRTAGGGRARFPLHDGLSVARFHENLFGALGDLGVRATILAKPYDLPFARVPFARDERHADYDAEAVTRFAAALRFAADVLEKFAGRYVGKTSPVHFFWHAFDLAMTRFSGRRAPPMPGATRVEREAYSHEVASFGFWPGDDDFPAAAFYAYAAPAPKGLADEPLLPRAARWNREEGSARLRYDVVRRARDPERTVTSFYESVFAAASRRADWAGAVPPPARPTKG